MQRKFTKYPSNYIRSNRLVDKGWKSPDTLEDGTIVWYKDVPEADCRFYIKENLKGDFGSPLRKDYIISYWFYDADAKPVTICDANDLNEAVAIAESEIEQYIAMHAK